MPETDDYFPAAAALPNRRRGLMAFPSEEVADRQEAWRRAVAEFGGGTRPRTLYVHIPFCSSHCVFCSFHRPGAKPAEMAAYVAALDDELARWADTPLAVAPINAVYFGGGTPTDLNAEHLSRLIRVIRANYRLANDCEITVEGRVHGFTVEKMRACVEAGANRFSVGVQTFDTKLRRSLGRRADKEAALAALETLSGLNQAAVVIDLLYGIPGQSMAMWEEDLRTALEDAKIDGMDQYRMNRHRDTPMDTAIAVGKMSPMPGDDLCLAMSRRGAELMAAAGANRISIKHYAIGTRERNINNSLGSWKADCLPFGVHSGGRLGNYSFRQIESVPEYIAAVAAGKKPLCYAGEFPPDAVACFEFSGQMGNHRAVNIAKVAAKASREFRGSVLEYCAPVLEDWRRRGFLSPGELGWEPLSVEAMFHHRRLAAEMMDKIAEAFSWQIYGDAAASPRL